MKKNNTVDPLRGSILAGLLRFGLPIAAFAMLQVLFSAMDIFVLSRFARPESVSAIGVSSSLINTAVDAVTGLGGGITVAFGTAYGRQDRATVSRLLHSMLPAALIIGGAVAAMLMLLSGTFITWVNCPQSIRPDALVYYRIYFLALPFTLVASFLSSAIMAGGNTTAPLLMQVAAQIVNLTLNLFFVIVLRWEVFGVAFATFISQVIVAAETVVYLMRRRDELRLDLRHLRLFRGTWQVWRIGIPATLEGLILNLSGVVISAHVNLFGETIIAGSTVARTIEGIGWVTIAGFAAAAPVFISQNYGAGSRERVKRSYFMAMLAAFLLAEAVGMILILFAEPVVSLFTGDPPVKAAAVQRLRCMFALYGMLATMNVAGPSIRALEDAKTPLLISLFCSVCFRLMWVCFVAPRLGTVTAVYVAFPLCWTLNTAISIPFFIRRYRKCFPAAAESVPGEK